MQPGIQIKLADLQLKGPTDKEPTAVLQRIELKGGRFNLQNQSIEADELALQGGNLDLLRRADGRLAMQDWVKTNDAALRTADKVPAPNKPWNIQLKHFALDGVRWRILDQGFISPITAQADNLKVDFNAEMAVGGAKPKLNVSNLAAHVAGLRVHSGASPAPLLALGELELDNGQVDLAAQKLAIGSIALRNGKLEAVRDAQGQIALIEALRMRPNLTTPTPRAAADNKPGWQYAVEKMELTGFQVLAKDLSTRPAAEITLNEINGGIAGLSQNLKAPLPVHLAFDVKQGGSFKAQGTVVAAAPSVDLKLKLANLAFAPAQPYLSGVANLQVASGALSTEGRLRYRNHAVKYDGALSVRDPLLNETGTKNRFLSWKSLATKNFSVTQKGLDIGELKLDRLGAKLIINADKSTNLQHVLASGKTRTTAAQATAAPSAGAAKKAAPFNVNIDRIRVQDGEVDFADLSLALPFGTRIHQMRADEDPGPITTANPKVRGALESVYKTRLGSDALQQFKAKYRQVNPDKEIDSGVGKLMSRLTELIVKKPQVSEQESAQLKGADFFELLYRRLLETVDVPDTRLQALAQARGEGALQELIAAGAPKERTALGPPEKVDGDSREVGLKLELGGCAKACDRRYSAVTNPRRLREINIKHGDTEIKRGSKRWVSQDARTLRLRRRQ